MTTAPREAVSIAPAQRSGEPSRAVGWLVLLGTSLALGVDAAAHARWAQLTAAAAADCVGVEARVGLVTRVLEAALSLLPLGAHAARSEASLALLVGVLAAALYALSSRVLARLGTRVGARAGALRGRRAELLALASALGLAWFASSRLDTSSAPGAVLLALGCERALAAWGVAGVAGRERRRRRAQLTLVLALLACEWAPFALAPRKATLHAAARGRDLDLDAGALDAVLDALLRELPPRALLIAGPELARTLCTALDEQRVRPDLRLVPPPWQLDARTALALERSDGSLRPLLRAQLLEASPAWPELQALAARRPLRLEPDTALPPSAARTLLPAGLWQQLATGDVGKSDLRLAALGADRTLERLAGGLSIERTEPALRAWLAATTRAHAAHEAEYGDPLRAARLTALSARWTPPAPNP